MNSKQRANLKAIASGLDPIFQIGKEGISQAQLKGMAEALYKRELIKISVLRSSEFSAEELLQALAEKLDAKPVTAIGNKIVIYKKSDNKSIKHLEF